MTKINLLRAPHGRGAKQQRDLQIEAGVAVGVLILTIGVCGYASITLDREVEAIELEKQQKQKQLTVLKEKAKQVQEFEQKKKLLEDKNRAIEQLRKDQEGPVRILDYVSQSLEPLKLWIVRLHAKGKEVEVEGRALTHDDIAEFVTNLRRTDYFDSVRLLETRSGNEGKITLYQFRMGLTQKG